MALGRRDGEKQGEFWVATEDIVRGPGHPFYVALNALFRERGFDRHVEGLCETFYSSLGRPGIAPGVYFRMLLVGYFEGIDSERGIDWRCGDSLTLREFLGYALTQTTPDHSTLCTTRQRIDIETHQEVFAWVLTAVAESGLLKGKTLGIDATFLEANAAMRSIVRRDTGDSYQQFLTGLAQASGIETPTREQLAKIDKTRKNKASNDDWESPSDGDSRITKMKDGSWHLAHKAEHAVDMDSGAVVAVTIQPADRSDHQSIVETIVEATEVLLDVREMGGEVSLPQEAVTDKGCHSNLTCVTLKEMGIRSYLSEPDRGERDWIDKKTGEPLLEARSAVHGNRRRIRGKRGKGLLRSRGQYVERTFADEYETGAMRRTHLRGHNTILKRLLIHTAGFNLALLLRHTVGVGKPRVLQDGVGRLSAAFLSVFVVLFGLLRALWTRPLPSEPFVRKMFIVPSSSGNLPRITRPCDWQRKKSYC